MSDHDRPPIYRRVLRRMVDEACRRSDRLARTRHIRRLRREERSFAKKPVFIYQMGKVGSTTVKLSLRASRLNRPIYHIHALDPDLVRANERQRRRYPRDKRQGALRRVWESRYLYDRLKSNPGSERWQIITLVRDPVARNVATFFEHLEILGEDEAAWHVRALSYDLELTVPKHDVAVLVDAFLERCRHDQVLNFFNREFKKLWGIDVFDRPFPRERGFDVYGNRTMQLLLLRLEDLDRCGARAMGEYLGRPDIALVQQNVGSAKPYAPIYSHFKRSAELPEDYLDRMYDSRFATHFYSTDELERFRQRWSCRMTA